MKIETVKDCEVTDPPSTCFVFYPEAESDLAFIAELRDLPTANRTLEAFVAAGNKDPVAIDEAQTNGMTARISLQSLAAHLMESPSSSEKYVTDTLNALAGWGIDTDTLLKKAFFIRTFWF